MATLVLTAPDLRAGMKARSERRLLPEIRRAFQLTATRVERYLVACYDSTDGGHFRPHRAPLGGAIVFSCSLLHEATAVTAGRRYGTVPFRYDEAGEAVRMRNLSYVGQ